MSKREIRETVRTEGANVEFPLVFAELSRHKLIRMWSPGDQPALESPKLRDSGIMNSWGHRHVTFIVDPDSGIMSYVIKYE